MFHSRWSKTILTVLVAGAAFAFATTNAHAITLSPTIIDIDKKPGEVYFGTLTVSNDNDQDTTYYLTAQNFVARGEEGQQEFIAEENAFGLATWIVPDVKRVTLGPRESKDINVAVSIPVDAEPGGHYAALFFSTQPETEEGGVSVGVGAKTGILFLARVAGDIREEATVESFRMKNESPLNRLPAFFELRVRNVGNVHFRLRGDIDIVNMFGHTVDRVPVNPLNGAALPDSIRRYDTAWAHTLKPAEGEGFIKELKDEWNNFAIGKYTATVNATYGSANKPLTAALAFWVIPWRILTAVLLLLVLLILLLKGYNKMVVRAALKKREP